jgi:carbamoyl-phosphate synthase large subunit
MVGVSLVELGLFDDPIPAAVAVKAPVFPFNRFPGADPVLGPEMLSTGEVIGLADDAPTAYLKALLGAGVDLQVALDRGVLFSLNDRDKPAGAEIARRLAAREVTLHATRGTGEYFAEAGVQTELVLKVGEGRPDAVGAIRDGVFGLIFNTPLGRNSAYDEFALRRAALVHGVPCVTTIAAAGFGVEALESAEPHAGVHSLQGWMAQAVS